MRVAECRSVILRVAYKVLVASVGQFLYFSSLLHKHTTTLRHAPNYGYPCADPLESFLYSRQTAPPDCEKQLQILTAEEHEIINVDFLTHGKFLSKPMYWQPRVIDDEFNPAFTRNLP